MWKINEDKEKVTPVITTLTLLFTALLSPPSKVRPLMMRTMRNCGRHTFKMVKKVLVQHPNPAAVHSVLSVCPGSLSKFECCSVV